MKNNYLYLNFTLALVVGIMLFTLTQTHYTRNYIPRSKNMQGTYSAQGAIDYLINIRANQLTKTIEASDVKKAQQQLQILSSRKSTESAWAFRGPNNIGGRTRALLIDKDNSNLMFAGGVAGGLWKSTTSGQYWVPVEYQGATSEDFANLAVVSICQAANGDIYFGTGEGVHFNHGLNTATPMILGSGIWKSTDRGNTFTKLTATEPTEGNDAFTLVFKMAADPSNANIVYASTSQGLKVSTDGGVNWGPAPLEESVYNNSTSMDVKVASDGSFIASIANKCFVKKAGASQFVLRSGQDELENAEEGHLISTTNIGRLEFAYAPQDPNIVFCAAVNQASGLKNIYKSTDGGDNWIVVGKGGSALFQPFGSQGIYDVCIAVNPTNKNQVFVGGLNLWSGVAANTGNLFAWSQVTMWDAPTYYSLYVHADQHIILFDPKDPQIMFVGSDGGVSRGFLNKDGVKYQFKTMNNNYGVTQFYSVAANSAGTLIGGTQDNGSLLVVKEFGTDEKAGYSVMGGDGGHVVMSQIMPNIAYVTMYFGGLWRNNDENYADWNTFYNSDLADYQGWTSGGYEPDMQSASFVTPITYWETDNDITGMDSVMFIAKKTYTKGSTVVFPSYNVNKAPVYKTFEKDYFENDTFYYQDPYRALFALGMKHEIWVTPFAANWNITIAQKGWWRVVKKNTMGADEYVTQMKFSADGNNLFFSTSENELYRISGFDTARTYKEADYIFGKPTTTITKIGAFNQAITGLACDPTVIHIKVVTLGNYSNDFYVYYCAQATTVAASSSFSNFTDVTGDLPHVPAFCALFEIDETKNDVLVGTDMGVFRAKKFSQQVGAGTIAWEPYQNGLGPVPVFQITQLTMAKWNKGNYGKIYIGTHGRGFYEDMNYVGIAEDDDLFNGTKSSQLAFTVFPNPIVDKASVKLNLKEDAKITVQILNLAGQVIDAKDFGTYYAGENTLELSCNSLKPGAYILNVKAGAQQGSARVVKK